MHGTAVVFGERVTLLDDGPARVAGHVLIPGPGTTVADRALRAVDPVAEQRRSAAAAALGIRPPVQDDADIPTAQHLCPPETGSLRHAAAILDLGAWRYKVAHCPPGPRLAALLDARPDDLAPARGEGPVTSESIDVPAGPGRPARTVAIHTSDPERAPAPAEGQYWPDTVLATIQARQKLISHLHAQQYADIAALSSCYPGIHQFLSTELALALHLTDTDATGLLAEAEALRDRLPATQRALAAGHIDVAKAHAIIRATDSTTADVARTVERTVLPDAEKGTATTVRRRAARAVIAADPDGAADRHRAARRERHVWRAPDGDGMARLGLYAPAQDVAAIWEAITAIAETIRGTGDTRTLGQRRADALLMICTDILAAGGWQRLRLPDNGRGRPRVSVTVPYTALLGHRAPCDLAGHGPISTEQALGLIAGGDLRRMICDPVSGMLLDYGHTRYRPPPHLAEFVKMRDGECPMPSCNHAAERNHIDHIIPARCDPRTGKPTLGTTSARNLAPPCAHHHLSKDADRGFALHRATDGTYTWSTPLGREYCWRPEPRWDPATDAIPCGAADEGSIVPICDCPDTWPCQRGPRPDPGESIPHLVPDGDYDDHFPPGSPVPDPESEPCPDARVESSSGPGPRSRSEPTPRSNARPDRGAESSSDPDPGPGSNSDPGPRPNPDPGPGSTSDPGPGSNSGPGSRPVPGSSIDLGGAVGRIPGARPDVDHARYPAQDFDPPPF